MPETRDSSQVRADREDPIDACMEWRTGRDRNRLAQRRPGQGHRPLEDWLADRSRSRPKFTVLPLLSNGPNFANGASVGSPSASRTTCSCSVFETIGRSVPTRHLGSGLARPTDRIEKPAVFAASDQEAPTIRPG